MAPKIKCMAVGGSGSGKTHFSATFPKCYVIVTEPGGEDTWQTRPELAKNVVKWVDLRPSDDKHNQRIFATDLPNALKEAREMALKGEIETFVIDNLTYLVENRWCYQEEFEMQYSKGGEENKLALYGDLARWLYKFVLMSVLTIPTNIVVNVHERMEDEKVLATKPDKTTPITPQILGGFRDMAEGMFSLVLYLTKLNENGVFKYKARTNKGNGRNAKSRYPNMPEVIDNISYAKIIELIEKYK